MTVLTIGGETFRVEVTGEATRPPLILSHSLGTDLSMWAGQMPAMTKHFRVIRYDTRGHGGSIVSEAPASIAQLGADAVAILDALEIDKAHWLGLSMGGAIGLWLLTNAPERIDRAVLANTAPKLGSAAAWNARITAILAGGTEENANATIERWFSPGFAKRAKGQVDAIRESLRSTSPQGYALCCAALRDMDLREALHGIEHEVLIVTGRDDPVVPDADEAAFAAAIKGAKRVTLDAWHMSNIEAEAAFNTAVIEFLTAQSPRAKTGPRKTAQGKTNATKRVGVSRRANAARAPLKKTAPKRTAAKKAPASTTGSGKAASSTGRRTAAKTAAARRGASEATVKKRPAKTTRQKTATARRSTSTTAARVPIKKSKPRKAVAKTSAKKIAAKTTTKKLPSPRRRPAKTPRRKTGRRKT